MSTRRSAKRRARRRRAASSRSSRQPSQRRRVLGIVASVALGLGVVAATIAVLISKLHVAAPVRQEPASLAVVPIPAPTPRAGVAVGMLVEVEDCSRDVSVTVVAAPTTEYWQAHPGAEELTFALPDARLGDVHFRLGQSASDVTTPQDVVDRGPRVVKADAPGIRRENVHYEGAGRDLLVARLKIQDWSRSLAPVIATYRADLLEDRGMASCWLRLPALTGDLSVLAAKRAFGLAVPLGASLPANPGDLRVASRRANAQAVYTPGLEAVHGSITVRSADADVEQALPAASSSTNGSPTWTCEAQPKTRARALGSARGAATPPVLSGTAEGASAGAFSSRVISSAKTGDCSAVAAVVESSAGWKRDVFMLFIGSIAGFGFGMVFDLLKPRWVEVRQEDGP